VLPKCPWLLGSTFPAYVPGLLLFVQGQAFLASPGFTSKLDFKYSTISVLAGVGGAFEVNICCVARDSDPELGEVLL
jgi:hypothetical protein